MEDGCVKRGDLVDSVTAEFFIVIFFSDGYVQC